MVVLETDRLRIRGFCADDWRDLQELAVQSVASEFARYDHAWPTSDDEVRGIAEWFAGGNAFLAVALKTTGKVIGLVSLNGDPEQEPIQYDLGYRFNADYHGMGYATEACRAVIEEAFGRLEADAIVAGTAEANGPSRALLARLALRETGRHMTSFRTKPDGEPDEFVGLSFAITRDEWLALAAQETLAAE